MRYILFLFLLISWMGEAMGQNTGHGYIWSDFFSSGMHYIVISGTGTAVINVTKDSLEVVKLRGEMLEPPPNILPWPPSGGIDPGFYRGNGIPVIGQIWHTENGSVDTVPHTDFGGLDTAAMLKPFPRLFNTHGKHDTVDAGGYGPIPVSEVGRLHTKVWYDTVFVWKGWKYWAKKLTGWPNNPMDIDGFPWPPSMKVGRIILGPIPRNPKSETHLDFYRIVQCRRLPVKKH